MKRKDFLKNGAMAAAGAASMLSACSGNSQDKTQPSGGPNVITSKKYRWKLVTTWPPKFPIFGEAANFFADWVKELSNGRINIKVYGGGELIPALEVFDAVSSGNADMGCGAPYYWSGKTPAAQFFCAIPFGMNAQQIQSWLLSGGGYELWKEVYADFNLYPFLGGNSGVQMGGWFNKEIKSTEDLKGLKMRLPGLAGKALEKAGGTAILVAGGEIYTSLERGVIDATEWVGPYHDYTMGFHKIAKYYYTPGWHEPGTQLEFMINKKVYDELPEDLKAILYNVSLRVQAWMLAEFDAQNAIYMDKLVNEEGVQLREFPEDVLAQLKKYNDEALDELVGNDPVSKKVYASYKEFLDRASKWSVLTEKAFYNKLQKAEYKIPS